VVGELEHVGREVRAAGEQCVLGAGLDVPGQERSAPRDVDANDEGAIVARRRRGCGGGGRPQRRDAQAGELRGR